MFAIEFVCEPHIEFNEPAIRGRITLGEFSEEFVAPLVFWSVDDYRKQWRDAAERIVNGEACSCFAASMRESPDDGAIFLWTAYKLADSVYFQHKLLLSETAEGAFEPSNIYAQIDERQTKTENGSQISEWRVSVSDVACWLRAG